VSYAVARISKLTCVLESYLKPDGLAMAAVASSASAMNAPSMAKLRAPGLASLNCAPASDSVPVMASALVLQTSAAIASASS